jgi:6-phosphofructokinase
LSGKVSKSLNSRANIKVTNKLKLGSFSSVCHFFGYQGRCALPNQFDQNLADTYGRISKLLIESDLTGYCPTVKGVSGTVEQWSPGAIPLVQMLDLRLFSTSMIDFRHKQQDRYPDQKGAHEKRSLPATSPQQETMGVG